MTATKERRGWLIAALAAAVAVLFGSVLVASVWSGVFRPDAAAGLGLGAGGPEQVSGSSRGVPALPGTAVNVSLANMGGPMMGQRWMMGGAMQLSADRVSVPAGTVSFVATNVGSIDHELVVLPLADNQQVGMRQIGSDGKIDEAGSLGEASNTGVKALARGSGQVPQGGSPSPWRPGIASWSATCPATTAPGCTPS